jgi:hypothetical protein
MSDIKIITKKRPKKYKYDTVKKAKARNREVKPIAMSELAKMLYFGTSKIPARPFLTDAILENKEAILKFFEKAYNLGSSKRTKNLNALGQFVVDAIKSMVKGNYYGSKIPNAPSTIDRKGSDIPLIESGDLIDALEYKVFEEGKKL